MGKREEADSKDIDQGNAGGASGRMSEGLAGDAAEQAGESR